MAENGAPRVSVVMAVYNEEETIDRSINSILGQEYEDFEFIIINDGSDDNTRSKIKDYHDSRIKFIENESNRGLSGSLNKGIDLSKGEYIARMDADDISLPQRLSRQVQYLDKQPDTQVVGCWSRICDQGGNKLATYKYDVSTYDSPEEIRGNHDVPAHSSVLMRKPALIKIGGYREEFKYAQDIDLWVRMARKYGVDFVSIIPEVLFEIRYRPSDFGKKRDLKSIYRMNAGNEDLNLNGSKSDMKNSEYNRFQISESYYRTLRDINNREHTFKHYNYETNRIIYKYLSLLSKLIRI